MSDTTAEPFGAWLTGTDDRPATPPPVHTTGNGYGAAIIDGETARVRAAIKGTRNDTLNVAAVKIGRGVAGGHVDEDAGKAALMAAALDVGLTRREASATIRSGLRYGKQHPRIPEEHPDAGPDRGARAPTDITGVLPDPPPNVTVTKLDLGAYLRPASWLLDRPPAPPPIWGETDAPLWATGQALMIAALPGLGKSTLAVQLVRARLGLDPRVLDLPVTEGKRVLYLCMDRPEQIAGLLIRAIDRDELAGIGDRLVLGWGPPPHDVARHPEVLTDLAHSAGADTIVVDSLKDAALKLTDDEIGAAYNRARQIALAAGIEVLELHHLVKRNADGKPPGSLADVYGSQHLTAGAGSVLCLVGEAGDPIVRGLHLKPVRESWGPSWLTHDHERGRTAVHERVDLLERLAVSRVETAISAACALFETEKPTRAQTERARRQLDRLVRTGRAYTSPGAPGSPTRYHPHTLPEPTTLGDDRP